MKIGLKQLEKNAVYVSRKTKKTNSCLIPLKIGQKESGVHIVDGERRIQAKNQFFYRETHVDSAGLLMLMCAAAENARAA